MDEGKVRLSFCISSNAKLKSKIHKIGNFNLSFVFQFFLGGSDNWTVNYNGTQRLLLKSTNIRVGIFIDILSICYPLRCLPKFRRFFIQLVEISNVLLSKFNFSSVLYGTKFY